MPRLFRDLDINYQLHHGYVQRSSKSREAFFMLIYNWKNFHYIFI